MRIVRGTVLGQFLALVFIYRFGDKQAGSKAARGINVNPSAMGRFGSSPAFAFCLSVTYILRFSEVLKKAVDLNTKLRRSKFLPRPGRRLTIRLFSYLHWKQDCV